MTKKQNIAVIIINDHNTADTKPYLEILRKHRKNLGKGVKLKGNYKEPIIIVGDDDEEVRTIIAEKFGTLTELIDTVDNKRKISSRYNTPKAVKTFFRNRRDSLLKDEGKFGEFAAFLMDLLDAGLYGETKNNLYTHSHMTDDQQVIRLNILDAMSNEVLINKRMPSSISNEEIIEIVLEKYPNLAKKEILINEVEKLLHR